MISLATRILPAILLLGLAAMPTVQSQEAPKKETAKAEPPKERVTKVGATAYRLGEIEFDAKSREIRFPAVMNMPEGGPIEYLLVHETGKVHESLLVTKARPLHLQIVMKLLKYKDGDGQIFDAFAPEEEQRRQLANPEKREQGDAVRVVASWTSEDGKKQEAPVAGLILDGVMQKPMSDEPWIFTGSHVMDGAFIADIEGSIIGVYLDQFALFNMNREGAVQDDRWGANEEATPPLGQKMTITLKPEKNPSQ